MANRKKNAKEWFEHGLLLSQENDFEGAIKSFNEAIKLRPTYYSAWFNKAIILDRLGKSEEALDILEEAIKLKPEDATVYGLKALLLQSLSRFDDAIVAVNRSIKIDRKDSRGWGVKALILHRLGLHSRALREINKAIRLEFADVSSWVVKARILWELEQYEEALESIEEALKLAPKDSFALYTKATILEKLEKYKDAVSFYEQAATLNPNEAAFQTALVNLMLDLGNLDGALEMVDKIVELDKKNYKAYILKGRISLERKKFDAASRWFETAAKINFLDPVPRVWNIYTKYLKVEFSFEDDEEEYKKEVLVLIRELERINALYEKSRKPEKPYILYMLGYLYVKIRDHFTAQQRLKKCVEMCVEVSIREKACNLLSFAFNISKPPWWRWWLMDPIFPLGKRALFIIVSFIIFLLSVGHSLIPILIDGIAKTLFPYLKLDIQSNFSWSLLLIPIMLLVFVILYPNIERIRTKDLEIEIATPLFEIVVSPFEIGNIIKQIEQRWSAA